MNNKYTYFLFFLALLHWQCAKDTGLSTNSCLPSNLQKDLLAFYSFGNGQIHDDTNEDNDLFNTTTAQPTTDRNNNADCAFEFDNRNANQEEFLFTDLSTFMNQLSTFSIALWYQPIDTTRGAGSYEVLINRGETFRCPDRRGEWSIGLYDCRRAVFGHNNSVWATELVPSAEVCQPEVNAQTGKWHHLVATKDGNNFQLFFNGVLDSDKSGNAACNNLHLAEDLGDIFVGKNYTGKIDDILIYNRLLTANEVLELSQLEPCCE